MAAHTFEMSPNWRRAHARADTAKSNAEPVSPRQDFDSAPASKGRRFGAAWIILPIAAALAGLAVFLSPGVDSAAERRSALPAAAPIIHASLVGAHAATSSALSS